MSEWYRDAFDEFYLELYSHRDQREADEFVSFLGETVALDGVALLDVCCGEGRYLRAFGKAGALGFGLDLSEALLKQLKAAQAGESSRVARADMRKLPFKSESFDICINMFTSLGYFETAEDELCVLRETRRMLRPGGLFVIDHLNPVWLKRTLEPRSATRKGGFLIEERRRITGGGRTVEKTMSVRSITAPTVALREYTERVTLFPRDELERMLEETGYGVLRLCGDYDGRPFQETTSPRLIVLARKG